MKYAFMKLCVIATILISVLSPPLHAEGEILWARYFGGSIFELGSDVIQCSGGGYAIAGTYNYTSLDPEFLLIRTDDQGNQTWSRTFGGSREDRASAVVQNNDGGFGIAGFTNSFGTSTDYNMLLYRTDPQGLWIWGNAYGASVGYEECKDLIHTGDDGYVLVGKTNAYGAGDFDMFLVKVDTAGNQLWQATFGSPDGEGANAGLQLSNGHFILAGYGLNATFHRLIEADSTGTIFQLNNWPDNTGLGLLSVEQNLDGTYIMAGTYHHSYMADQMRLWKQYTSWALPMWTSYGGVYPDNGTDAVESPNGGYLIVGSSMSFGSGVSNVWMVKTDTYLDSLWSQYFTGGGMAWATSVIVNSDGNYIITGGVWNSTNNSYDVLLLCVSGQPTAVEPESTSPPYHFAFTAAYPNPFNPSTVLSFELRVPSLVKLEVFDIYGRAVGANLCVRPGSGQGAHAGAPLQWYPAGAHQITFNGAELPSGIYFAKLTAGTFSQVQKLVLLK